MGVLSKACLVALFVMNGGVGVALLANARGAMEDAGVPLSDLSKFSDLSREGFLHMMQLYGVTQVSLASFMAVTGTAPSTFAIATATHAAVAFFERKVFETYSNTGLASAQHLDAVSNEGMRQLVCVGIAAVGLFSSLARRNTQRPKED